MAHNKVRVGITAVHRRTKRAAVKHGRFAIHITKRILAHSGEIAVVVLVASVVLQFLYPADRALPFMRVSGVPIGGQAQATTEEKLADLAEQQELTIKTPSREWQIAPQTLGVTARADASAELATQYQWWERMLPFSAAVKVMQSSNSPLLTVTDKERLKAFAQKLVAEDTQAAQDATIRVKDGGVVVDAAKEGYRFAVDDVVRQLASVSPLQDEPVYISPQSVSPRHNAQDLQAIAVEAERILSKTVTVTVADKSYRIEPNTVGEWLSFPEDPQTKKITIAFKAEAIRAYLDTISKEMAIAPGVITVTLVDGQETGRTAGGNGRSVTTDAALDQIQVALRGANPAAELNLPVVVVPPKIEYKRSYSPATTGLQAIVADWERQTYGDYGVIVREIGGAGRYTDYQPDKSFVTASTYKMFLAYTVFTKIERGEIRMDQTTDIGWTVQACINEMILHSTNPCAISLQNMVGWQTVDDMLHQAGFGATRLNNQGGGDKHTTVRDEASFLARLNAGTLMSANHNAYLLDLFKRQVWRGGIPSGVPRGTVVANKVGFYNGWVHDVAIVYSPKATYILAIMSKGGSDPAFADLSRRIYGFFNQ